MEDEVAEGSVAAIGAFVEGAIVVVADVVVAVVIGGDIVKADVVDIVDVVQLFFEEKSLDFVTKFLSGTSISLFLH